MSVDAMLGVAACVLAANMAAVQSGGQAAVFDRLNGSLDGNTSGVGAVVCVMGDVDGDGVRDLAVSRSPGGNWAGGVPTVAVVSGSSAKYLWSVEGDMFDTYLGASLSRLSDLNGDSVDDLLVGTPTDVGDPTNQDNFAWVLSGADGSHLARVRGNEGQVEGWGGNDRFGASVCGAGDINEDGIEDFWVGATLAFGAEGQLLGRGSIRGYCGKSGEEIRRFDADSNRCVGSHLARTNDLDGDGVGDVATVASVGESWLHVLSGGDATALYWVKLPFSNVSALENVGDVDGDSSDDLAIGAWGREDGGVVIVSGATGKAIFDRGLGQPGEARLRFVSALATVPDLDGDGVKELAIGLPGVGGNKVEVRSLVSGEVLISKSSERESGEFGSAVAAADLDGDGRLELIVGEPGTYTPPDLSRTWAGSVHVFPLALDAEGRDAR